MEAEATMLWNTQVIDVLAKLLETCPWNTLWFIHWGVEAWVLESATNPVFVVKNMV